MLKFQDFPWFGLDIGGTLVKLVYFAPLDLTEEEELNGGDALKEIRQCLIDNTTYGAIGIRDVHLEVKSIKMGNRLGNLHFIRFPVNKIELFIDLCVKKKLNTIKFQVFASGGGSTKFESIIKERLKIDWNKCDEYRMFVKGINFLNEINSDKECFYFETEKTNNIGETVYLSLADCKYTKKNFNFTNSYPYVMVIIGTAVSILLVESATKYKMISGSTIGGGTFTGLCCLLTGCSTYEKAIELAIKGNNHKVDKLFHDICEGGFYGIPGNVVVSK